MWQSGFVAGLGLALAPGLCEASPLSLVIATERTDSAKDCANHARLLAKVERLSQRAVEAEGPLRDSIHVVVHFDRINDEYRASLEFRGPKPGERSLRDRSNRCDSLEDAVAVAIALLLDSEIERRAQATPDLTRAVPTIRITSSEVKPRAHQSRTTPWYVSVQGGPEWGFSTTAVTWFAVDLGVRPISGWVFEASAVASQPATTKYAAGEVTVSLVAGALRACRLWGESWQFGPCAAMALGRLHGTGRGFDESMSTNLLWPALGASLILQRSLGERWNVGLSATTWIPLSEVTFSVDNLGTAWNSSVIWLGLGARLGVRFR